jgi:GNAT superfamily N-acetyltransferase
MITGSKTPFILRLLSPQDRGWVAVFSAEHWGSDKMVVHGDIFFISQLPGFCAEVDGQPAGLVTYTITGAGCEILSLDSLQPGVGIGSALIDAVRQVAIQHGCCRLFLSTTNDNLDALYFYQKRGFVLAALRPGAVNESRKIKPEIPIRGDRGLPIRDEIELQMELCETDRTVKPAGLLEETL